MDDTTISFVVAAVSLLVGICSLLSLTVALLTFRVWIRARVGGVGISLFDIVGMRLRGAPAGLLVDAMLDLKRRGAEAATAEVERAYSDHQGQRLTPSELADLVVHRRADR